MARYLLIDGHNFLFAAQHSGARLTAGGQQVTAVFRFLGSLRNVMERFPGSIPIVLWDGSPSWRHEVYPEYKANRDKNATVVKAKEDLREQRPIVKEILTAMGVRQYRVQGEEADDLAGYLSREMGQRGADVVLVTRDGDWLQLVDNTIHWYDHKNNKVVHNGNFKDHTGYETPDKFAEGKFIQGDAGDNVPGVGGLGEGAAALICRDFDSLPHLVLEWDRFKPTIAKGSDWARYKTIIGRALEDPEILKRYDRNVTLMYLRNRTVSKEKLVSQSRYNEAELKRLFASVGFHSILRKYEAWMAPIRKGIVE